MAKKINEKPVVNVNADAVSAPDSDGFEIVKNAKFFTFNAAGEVIQGKLITGKFPVIDKETGKKTGEKMDLPAIETEESILGLGYAGLSDMLPPADGSYYVRITLVEKTTHKGKPFFRFIVAKKLA